MTAASTEKPPPDAAEARIAASPNQSALDKRLTQDGTQHDPRLCVTCRGGIEPWTEARRLEATTYAATSGRRICDLQEVGR